MLKQYFNYLRVTLIFICVNAANAYTQPNCPPANIGFENGSFEGWNCSAGHLHNLVSGQPVTNRHTLIGKGNIPNVDKFGKFPLLCPNGSKFSIKLGNEEVGAEAEQVSYTFTIEKGIDNYSLFFNYAVVLENPAHSPENQPRFTARVFNVTDGGYIECASFDFIAGPNLPGFKRSKVGSDVYYKDWATANINLQGYAGKTFRIEFTTNDCLLGGHFGYAYLDLNQNCTLPITGNAYCSGQNSVTLTGPPGFDIYQWYDKSNLAVGTGQALHISPPPPDNTSYSLVLTPSNGLGCVATLKTTVNKINAGFNFVAVDTIFSCPGSTVDITDPNITKGSMENLSLSYSSDADGVSFLYNPDAITKSGTYYITALSANGCTNTLPVVVNFFDSLSIKIIDPKPVVYPTTVALSSTFTHVKGVTYSYFKDSTARDTISQNVNMTGRYYIKSVNYLGCSSIVPVQVVVTPPLPAIISAPNTFTPNGDGINDLFFIVIKGFNELKKLKIYNRNGELVFETKSINNYWDGTYNGLPLNTGVYYWVYEGLNTYDRSETKQAGYITILR